MTEPLALLLLPERLEDFSLQAHARDLLAIPRVVALDPPRLRPRGWLAEAVAGRQARRLRLPGEPRLIMLYHAAGYPLARALLGRHPEAELWYSSAACVPQTPAAEAELAALERLARERAAAELELSAGGDPRLENEPLRARLLELGVISSRVFVPGAKIHAR
jgi:hypothetical protein